jgi:hypothetical protein
MAEVKMDLAELEDIKNQIVKQKKIVSEKEEVIKQKEKELAEAYADKRTVQITKTSKPVPSWDFHANSINSRIEHSDFSYGNEYVGKIFSFIKQKDYMRLSENSLYENIKETINQLVFNISARGDMQRKNVPITYEEIVTKEFINFDDVLGDLREKAEVSFINEINSYKTKIHTLEGTVSDLQNKITDTTKVANKKIDEIIESYETKLQDNSVKARKEYEILSKAFSDYKEDKDTRNLQKQIFDLKTELEEERQKKWYQKIIKNK